MKHMIRKLTVVTLMVIVIGATFVLSGQADTLTTATGDWQIVPNLYQDENTAQYEHPMIHLEANRQGERYLQQANDGAQRTVTVSGNGEAQAQPDQATIRLGVQTQAETADQALSENNSKIQALLNTLEQAGVLPEAIQTTALRLQPRYEDQPFEAGAHRIASGYIAANIVEVKVNDLENLGELLNAAVEAGGNTIEGVTFEVSNATQLLDQAREAAMQDANHRAEQLATLADASLGEVLSINESSVTPFAAGRGPMALEAATTVPLEPGSQSIAVNVQVTWLLQ